MNVGAMTRKRDAHTIPDAKVNYLTYLYGAKLLSNAPGKPGAVGTALELAGTLL